MQRLTLFALVSLLAGACAGPPVEGDGDVGDVGAAVSSLTSAERRVRAGQIRDAASANGITQGWLLAGIADAETQMSHCHSELTWACMGPTSVDCGGGPIVAGAGDGPCSLMQGGLGMFQFDAGTYSQTLAREGTRILTIAGNTAAGVDFVVDMVIRSAYVSGVSTRAQAVAWTNNVRVGNGQWDAWVRTVTHYYNGCAPSYSCFPERYARYRDYAANVYTEMGADFWTSSPDYGAEFVSQTFPVASEDLELYPGEEMTGYIEMRNIGDETWTPGRTRLGTTGPRDMASPIAGSDWINDRRAAAVDRDVPPGATGRFEFSVRAPSAVGEYPQFFNLVEEGVAWFGDRAGPPDDQLQIRVSVVPAPPCPAGTGAAWICEGDGRVRCEFGAVERGTCPSGCAAGACLGDMDGDGFAPGADCDDSDPTSFPGAVEVCGDGVDQDCTRGDLPCDPGLRVRIDPGFSPSIDEWPGEIAGGPPGPRTGGGLTGSCSASPSPSSNSGASGAPGVFGLAFLLLFSRRRAARRL